jgi:hypothetical protein
MIVFNLPIPAVKGTTNKICIGGDPTKGEIPKVQMETQKNLQIMIHEETGTIIIKEGK